MPLDIDSLSPVGVNWACWLSVVMQYHSESALSMQFSHFWRYLFLLHKKRAPLLAELHKGDSIAMFTYVIENTSFDLKTPGISDPSQVKREIIEQTASKTVTRFTYSTGLVLEVDQQAKRNILYSNRPLIKNPDGSYTAPEK